MWFYRSAGKGVLERLDILYHSTIWFATNAPHRTHRCTLYSSVNWSYLYTRRMTHWLMLIYQTRLGLTPPYLRDPLQTSSSTYNTCSAAIQLCMRCLLASLLFTKFLEQIPVGTFHKLYPPKSVHDWVFEFRDWDETVQFECLLQRTEETSDPGIGVLSGP